MQIYASHVPGKPAARLYVPPFLASWSPLDASKGNILKGGCGEAALMGRC